MSSSHHQLSNKGCSITQIDDFPSTIDTEPTMNHCAKKTSRYMHETTHVGSLLGFWDNIRWWCTFIALNVSPPGGHMGLIVPIFPALQSVDIGIHPRFTTGHWAGHGVRRGSGCRRNLIAKSNPKNTHTQGGLLIRWRPARGVWWYPVRACNIWYQRRERWSAVAAEKHSFPGFSAVFRPPGDPE